MNLFLVGLELSPIATRSSAADSLLALSKSLRLLDHEVTIVMPYFESFASSGMMAARRISPLSTRAGSARVYESTLPSGAKLVLLELAGQPYEGDAFAPGSTPTTALGFADAVVRLVLERVQHGQSPDLVHAFGARAGLVLPLLRFEDAAIGRMLSLSAPYENVELSPDLLSEWKLEGERSRAARSLVEIALDAAECVASPTRHVQDSFLEPLATRSSVLRLRERGLVHVVPEGIDVGNFNPSSDPALPFRYTPHDRRGKGRSRARFIEERKLSQGEERPLVVLDLMKASSEMITRALDAVPGLVRQGVLSVLRVAPEVEPQAKEIASQFAERVCVDAEPGPARRRLLLGSADFWIFLGTDDGTGRAVSEAQRYGAIPVVETSSAFAERIISVDADLYSGNALVFAEGEGLVELSGRVIACYRTGAFGAWIGRVMAQDFAWDRAARRHLQLYRQLLRGSSSAGRPARNPAEATSAL